MKLSKLLVLSALMATSVSSAKAAVPDGIWTMPEPQGLEFTTFTDDGTRYYLYNPATKMFFASGNGWNTMASLRTFGMEIWVTPSTEADAPEGSYELYDNNVNNPARSTGVLNMFTDDGNSTWVDHGTQGNYSWAFEIVGDCVRFQNVALIADKPEFTGMYLGFDGTYVTASNSATDANHRDAYTAILRHVDPSAAGVSVDWKAVTEDSYLAFVEGDAYQAYQDGAKQYIASMGLKQAIEDAEALWIDTAEALAVYTNAESTPEQMAKAQADLNELIAAKQKLKAAIDDYEAKGFTDTAAAKAVLQNTAATKAEVEQALADLDAAYVAWGSSQASVENPLDLTSMIVNPTFDNADATTGWSGTAFGRGGTVSDGAEHYSKTYDTYQKIAGLKPGVYVVGVNGYYRAGNYGGDAENHWKANDEASKYAKFYAKSGEKTYEVAIANVMSGYELESLTGGVSEVTIQDEDGYDIAVYVPNTMAAGDYYFHTLHKYANKLYAVVDESGELTIGVKKSEQIGGDWSMFDDFSLTFYGSGADAVKLFANEAWTYEPMELDEEEVLFTESYLTAYNNLVAGYDPTSVTTIEAFLEQQAAVNAAYEALQKNISLWKEWKAAVEKAGNRAADLGWTDPWGDVSDYLLDDVEDIEYDRELTNEQLEAEIAKIAEMIAACETFAKNNLKPGSDVTFYIQNADFESGIASASNPSGLTASGDNNDDGSYGTATGWHADKTRKGNFTPGPLGSDLDQAMINAIGKTNHCFEAWHCWGFDLWQEVNDLPAGVYQLDVQGYVRNEGNATTIPVKLYLNNMMTDFADVYSEEIAPEHYNEDGTLPVIESWSWSNNYPNSMGAASLCFEWGMYKKSAYGLVQEGQPMRIGVKSVDMNSHWWCIWDNFKLTYQGFLPYYVKDALNKALETIDLEGKLIGSDVRAKAEELVAKAQSYPEYAVDDNDTAAGREMYDLLNEIYDITPAVEASEALFAQLVTACGTLENALQYSEASAAVQAEGQQLLNTVTAICTGEASCTNAEAEDYLEQIPLMITKLGLPANVDTAADNNPIALNVIVNPEYEEGLDGWSGTAAAWSENDLNVEIFGKDFDYYQEIAGLPAGTYQVSVQGFYRAGGAADDYKAFTENPDSLNYAFLYAMCINGTDTLTSSKPLTRLAAEANSENLDMDGWVTVVEATDETEGLAVANTMSAAAYEFASDRYANNVVTFKVNEGNKVRLGLKKTVNLDNNWTIWDSWRLTYFGTASSLTPDGDAQGIETANVAQPVKVEFFTLDGRKTNGMQKGIMIQKLTLDNGTVVVRKIRK